MTNRQILNQAEEEASQATESTGETRARWVDGRRDGWMERWTAGEMERWKDRQMNSLLTMMDGQIHNITLQYITLDCIYLADFSKAIHSKCIQKLRCTPKSARIN